MIQQIPLNLWKKNISIRGKDKLFEENVSEYAKVGVGCDRNDMVFSIDDDF